MTCLFAILLPKSVDSTVNFPLHIQGQSTNTSLPDELIFRKVGDIEVLHKDDRAKKLKIQFLCIHYGSTWEVFESLGNIALERMLGYDLLVFSLRRDAPVLLGTR